jgi:hypothetical protein
MLETNRDKTRNAQAFLGLAGPSRPLEADSAIKGENKKGVKWEILGRECLTFPMTTLPRPPPGAHSSLATLSSLFARIVRQRVVVPRPWELVSVWKSLISTIEARRCR